MWRRLPLRSAWRSSRCSILPREQCPLPDERLIEAANTGMLPLSDRNGVKYRGGAASGRQPPPRRGRDIRRRHGAAHPADQHRAAARVRRAPQRAGDRQRAAVDELRSRASRTCRRAVGRRAPHCWLCGMPRAGRARGFRRARRGDDGGRAVAWRCLSRLDRTAAARPVQRALHAPAAAHVLRSTGCRPTRSSSRSIGRQRRCPISSPRCARSTIRWKSCDIKFVLEPDDRDTRDAIAASATRPAVRDHHRARRRTAHQAEGAQRRAAVRPRHVHRGVRRRGPAGAGPASPRARGIRRATTNGSPACRRGSPSTTPRTAGSRGCSPPNTPACSTCSCRGSPHGGCRCRSAARRTIFAPRRCARSAAGTPTT